MDAEAELARFAPFSGREKKETAAGLLMKAGYVCKTGKQCTCKDFEILLFFCCFEKKTCCVFYYLIGEDAGAAFYRAATLYEDIKDEYGMVQVHCWWLVFRCLCGNHVQCSGDVPFFLCVLIFVGLPRGR